MNRNISKRLGLVSFLLLCDFFPKQLYAVDLNQEEMVSEEITTTEELGSISAPLIEDTSAGSPSQESTEVFEDIEIDKDTSEDQVDEKKAETDEISSKVESTLIDSGTLPAGGEWAFYSNGLLYFDGEIAPDAADNWSKYAEDIKEIEIGHASLIGDYSGFFSRYENVESITMGETYLNEITNMRGMFANLSKLKEVTFGYAESRYSSHNVIDMSSMFLNCSSLTELDIGNLDTSSATNLAGMFDRCYNLTELDSSNFDTRSAINMSAMFGSCRSLTKLDLSNFDTSSVTNMASMFAECSSLIELDLSNFDTSSVINMSDMFLGCSSLTELDLSNFDTSSVTNIAYMFAYSYRLTKLDISSFDTRSATSMDRTFYGSSSITELKLGKNTKFSMDIGLSTPSRNLWKGMLEGNLLSKSEELIAYHNALDQANTYLLIEHVSLVFDSLGGSQVDTIIVPVGETWSKPTNPTKEGFLFSGWYLDREYTQPFDFTIPASQNTTVYAKWSEEYIVHIPAKIQLNSEDILSVSGINNGAKTLEVAINNQASKIDDSRKLQLYHKKDNSISTNSQLEWDSYLENPWVVLSVPAEEKKESEIQMSRPANSQAGQYEGQLVFTISYE